MALKTAAVAGLSGSVSFELSSRASKEVGMGAMDMASFSGSRLQAKGSRSLAFTPKVTGGVRSAMGNDVPSAWPGRAALEEVKPRSGTKPISLIGSSGSIGTQTGRQEEDSVEESHDDDAGSRRWPQLEKKWLTLSVAAAAWFLEAGEPAFAKEAVTRFSPDEWNTIYITTGAWVVLYFVVIPLIVFNYLRLRWFKRNTAETYFQFLLVFLFFPGMLLLAPFINFRRLPNDAR